MIELGIWAIQNLSIEGMISLPALLVGFLVALAIYNFEDSCKGIQIDAPTVISQVVKVDSVITAILLVSFLPILWPHDESGQALFLLPLLGIIYLLGLLLLVQSLQRSFSWARSLETRDGNNFRTSMRMKYLEYLKDNEKRDAWEKIWQADDKTRKLLNERQLIKLFVASVKKIKDKDTFAAWLVLDLLSTVRTISLEDPVVVQELTDLCMSDGLGLSDDTNSKERRSAGDLHYAMALRRLFFKILENTLEQNDNSFYTLIDSARTFLKTDSIDEVSFIEAFAPNFFSQLENKDDQSWIWEIFPDDWKITLDKLTNENTKGVAFAWLNAYTRWLHGKNLYTKKSEINLPLDQVTRELLPSIDPIQWARLFAFHWSAYGVEDGESSEHAQVRSMVENHLTFGIMGHVHTFWGEEKDVAHAAIRSETDELFDLIAKTTLFPFFHDDAVVSKYLKAIKELRSDNGDDEARLNKLQWLEMALKEIRKRIHQSRKSASTKSKRRQK